MHHKIWNKALGAGETIEVEFTLSSRYLYFNLIFWMVIGLVLVPLWGIGIIIFAIALFYFGFLLRRSNMFAFTNKRILIHRGWLSTSMTSVNYSQITDVEVRQGLAERLLYRSGTLLINTAGSSAYEVTITNVENPYGLKQKLSELVEKDEHAPHNIAV